MELRASKAKPPIGAIITAKIVKKNVNLKWDKDTEMTVEDSIVLTSSASISR